MAFPLWLYLATFLAIDLSIIASCWGLGWPFKHLLKSTASGAENLFFRVVLGSGVWVTIVFVLGLTHCLYKSILEIVLLISLIACIIDHKTLRFKRPEWLSAGLMAASFMLSFWYSMYPARFYDDLNYNLPLVEFFLKTHSIDPAWHLRFPVCNQATNLLFLPLQAFANDIGAQQLSVVSFQLILLGIYCCALRFSRDVKAGQIAVLACLSATHMLELSVTAYIEMNFALSVFAAIYAWLCALDVKDVKSVRNWSILAGLFLGLSFGSHIFGLVTIMSVLLVDVVEIVQLKEKDRIRSKTAFDNLIIMGPVALLTCLPWAIRNYIYTKNPFFPYADQIFGLGGIWDNVDVRNYFCIVQQEFGLATNFINLLRLPLELSFPTPPYTEPSMFPMLLLAFLLAIPFSFLPHSRTIGRLLSVITISITSWFYFGHQASYLTAVAPLVAILTGITLNRVWVYIKGKDNRTFALTFITASVLAFGAVGKSLAFLAGNNDPIPKNTIEKDALLNKWMPISRAVFFANTLPSGVLYTYKNPYINFLYTGRSAGDQYGPSSFAKALEHSSSTEMLRSFLKTFNVDYFLVEANKSGELKCDLNSSEHFHKVYQDDLATLYKVL